MGRKAPSRGIKNLPRCTMSFSLEQIDTRQSTTLLSTALCFCNLRVLQIVNLTCSLRRLGCIANANHRFLVTFRDDGFTKLRFGRLVYVQGVKIRRHRRHRLTESRSGVGHSVGKIFFLNRRRSSESCDISKFMYPWVRCFASRQGLYRHLFFSGKTWEAKNMN